MAFHKVKEYDPTEAFIQNERQQKLLELKLETIDKQWYNQLKHLSRDRLETMSEFLRLEDEKNQLDYFDDKMDVHKLKEYTDGIITQMKILKRELSHDNYNFDNPGEMHMKRTLQGQINLPKLDENYYLTKTSESKGKKTKRTGKKQQRKRRKSNLFRSKIFSISDSNLDKFSKYRKEGAESDEEDESQKAVSLTNIPPAPTTVLPSLFANMNLKKTGEQHRYLKEKMQTTLMLPTVTESPCSRQRKLSV